MALRNAWTLFTAQKNGPLWRRRCLGNFCDLLDIANVMHGSLVLGACAYGDAGLTGRQDDEVCGV